MVSDVAAGLILVQLEQQKKPLRLRVTPFGNELQQRSQRLTDVVPSSIDYLAGIKHLDILKQIHIVLILT